VPSHRKLNCARSCAALTVAPSAKVATTTYHRQASSNPRITPRRADSGSWTGLRDAGAKGREDIGEQQCDQLLPCRRGPVLCDFRH
jgi:hypothetical protein